MSARDPAGGAGPIGIAADDGSADRDLTVAIDVGGTKLAGAVLDAGGVRLRLRRPTPGPPGAADPGSRGLRALAAELAVRAGGVVRRVGLGCCEYVDRSRLTSREVLDWGGQPVEWLAELFPDAAVVVESDVRCGLLAERELGALGDADSAAFVSWGTGLSSALLLGGRVWSGARGRAIALGELPAPGPGTLEGYASGAGMAARWCAAGGPAGSGRELLAAAADGDPVAAVIAETAGVALAEALAGVVNLADPALVVLGGGLGAAENTPAHRALRFRWTELGDPAPLRVAWLGADGPLLGAALAAGWRAGAPRS